MVRLDAVGHGTYWLVKEHMLEQQKGKMVKSTTRYPLTAAELLLLKECIQAIEPQLRLEVQETGAHNEL